MEKREIAALTGVRGYAAIWVILYHMDQFAGTKAFDVLHYHVPVVSAGYLGVDLFFILSGFVLTLTYWRSMTKLDYKAVEGFIVGRFFRVMPLNWAVLAITAAMAPCLRDSWLYAQSHHDLQNMVASAFLVQQWLGQPSAWVPPAWSLSAELLLYILFPALIVVVARLDAKTAGGALLTAFLALLISYIRFGHSEGLQAIHGMGLLRCILEFPMGMLLFALIRNSAPTILGGNSLGVIALVLLVPAIMHARFELLAIPAFCLLTLYCFESTLVARAIFSNRLAMYLGKISFSLYLAHWLVLNVLYWLVATDSGSSYGLRFLALLAVAPISVVAAMILNSVVEVRSQKHGRALRDWLVARSTNAQPR